MLDCRGEFARFPLDADLVRGLEDSAHFRATKMQEEVIEKMELGRPLILCSPSGTGKTCAFSILMFQSLCEACFKTRPRRPPYIGRGSIVGLVLAPSPELCEQIAREMTLIGRHIPLSVMTIVSSIKLEDDWEVVAASHIVIGTPGIVAKLVAKKKLKLFSLRVLVIDEWDKMLVDKGLVHDLEILLKRPMPVLARRVCASATLSDSAYQVLSRLMPADWQIVRYSGTNRGVRHLICRAGAFAKRIRILVEFLRNVEFHQAVIFCNMRQLACEAETALCQSGFPAVFISSQCEQKERLDKIAEFRDMQIRCLVTTDIVARGLDVTNVNIVVCLDFPYDNETFLHRIGRSGRFMSDGISLTFYKRQESKRIEEIRASCGVKFDVLDMDNLPRIQLPMLENETQIENYRLMKEWEAHDKADREDCQVPLMPFCDMDNQYWDNYARICDQFKPPACDPALGSSM